MRCALIWDRGSTFVGTPRRYICQKSEPIDVGLLPFLLLKFVAFPFLYAKVNRSQV
jgi:hypothetical protein